MSEPKLPQERPPILPAGNPNSIMLAFIDAFQRKNNHPLNRSVTALLFYESWSETNYEEVTTLELTLSRTTYNLYDRLVNKYGADTTTWLRVGLQSISDLPLSEPLPQLSRSFYNVTEAIDVSLPSESLRHIDHQIAKRIVGGDSGKISRGEEVPVTPTMAYLNRHLLRAVGPLEAMLKQTSPDMRTQIPSKTIYASLLSSHADGRFQQLGFNEYIGNVAIDHVSRLLASELSGPVIGLSPDAIEKTGTIDTIALPCGIERISLGSEHHRIQRAGAVLGLN